ncbi:hypothetical protein B0H14DRAFT_3436848 [Mycena olivaceomarginata]|nr:hypothetical protein B0H14DRAFT_3436848 [Mycena olivaceomarginata]
MSAYAAQMTHANLMNYDIFGDWSPAPGPNAPLGTLCGTSSQPQSSAEAAFLQWTAAKLPASKLLLACLSTAMKDMQEPEVSRWTVVSYDDTSSLTDKAAFAKSNGSHLIKSVSSLRAFF